MCVERRPRTYTTIYESSQLIAVMVERLFLAVPWGCLRFVIVVFPDHTHLLFLKILTGSFLADLTFIAKTKF